LEKAYLILENGRVFEGERFGAHADALGECVAQTSVVGYVETLTEKSNFGKIVVQTFPLIGNYGVQTEDAIGECLLSGYVVREASDMPSNFRSEMTLDQYMKTKGVSGIKGIDTREIALILRKEGAMNAAIVSEIPENLEFLKTDPEKYAVARAGAKEYKVYKAACEKKFTVALMDFGARRDMLDALCALGCEVHVFPWDSNAEDVLRISPDGIVLSEGPGNPMENKKIIHEVRKLAGQKPVFAAGLGHQILALSLGARTEKMAVGHRGANYSVVKRMSTKLLMTQQNHGYTVIPASLPAEATQAYKNAADDTCEGIDYPSLNAFSVQFTPDRNEYERFISMMGGEN